MRSPHLPENPYQRQDLSGKPLQRADYFETLGRCSLAERYMKSDLAVILELGLKSDRLTEGFQSAELNIETFNRPIFILQFNANNPGDGDHRDEEKMFVVDVEGVDGQNVGIPSLVTLHAINYEIENVGRWAYTGIRKGICKPLSGLIGADGKLVVPLGGLSGFGNDFNPRNIESGSQIVNCISGNQCKVGSQAAIHQAVVKELFPRLSIQAKAGSVTVGRGKESLLEIRDVLVGPFDFTIIYLTSSGVKSGTT